MQIVREDTNPLGLYWEFTEADMPIVDFVCKRNGLSRRNALSFLTGIPSELIPDDVVPPIRFG
jgi:hypothetical protein